MPTAWASFILRSAETEYFVKKWRKKRILEKFYDANIIDVRDGLVKKGLELGMQQDEPPRIEGLRQKRR